MTACTSSPRRVCPASPDYTHLQNEILLILMAGNVFNHTSTFDNTMNIVLSIVLIGISVLFIGFFILQVH